MRTPACWLAILVMIAGADAAQTVVETGFDDGTLAPLEAAQYGDGEASVTVVEGMGRDGTACARIENVDPGARAAVKYGMRYERGRAYTISFHARAEEGTAVVSAYLDTGDWRLKYPGGYCAGVEVGQEWQEVTYTNIHRQGRGYLANVRNDSQTPILVDDVVITESEGRVAINRAAAEHGASPSADSIYTGYRPDPINDGLQMHIGNEFDRRATATTESAEPHWVQVRFAGPRPISRVVVYWNVEEGTVYSSRRFEVLAEVEDQWQTVAEVEQPEPTAFSAVEFDQVEATAVRVLQPAGGGSAQRPNLLWVSEVEAY